MLSRSLVQVPQAVNGLLSNRESFESSIAVQFCRESAHASIGNKKKPVSNGVLPIRSKLEFIFL